MCNKIEWMLQQSFRFLQEYCSTHLFYFIAHKTNPVDIMKVSDKVQKSNKIWLKGHTTELP